MLIMVTPAQAVVGTGVTETAYDFTARLNIGNGVRACSAALVAPQWLAASASCFSDDGASEQVASGAPKWKTTATLGRSNLNATGGQVREVVEIVPRPGRDVVMARLSAPTTGITPVPTAITAPGTGEELQVAGFGRTKGEWAPIKLHKATFKASSLTHSTLGISGKTAADAICAGDAGAPIVRTAGDGGFELVALVSRSWQGGCFGSEETRTDAIGARLDNIVVGNKIITGTTLFPGDNLVSNSMRLTMQSDGDLVITANGSGKALWSTKTAGHAGATARFTVGGNLIVVDADGTTVLWESKTSAANGTVVLQNRGNLVIYNGNNESQWSSGTVVRHDYDGDGRSDMASWYDYSDGSDKIHTFLADAAGKFQEPGSGYVKAKGTWWAEHMKFATGDFNGDGRGDVAAFYGYDNGSVSLFTWLATGDGKFAEGITSWTVPAGNWTWSRIKVQSGDFNGDGRDDVAAWYDYADGSDKLFTFTAKANGGFNAPFSSFSKTSGWTASRMKFTTGDYNADGRDDIGVFYGYADGNSRLFTFTAKPTGGFGEPLGGWEDAKWGSSDRTSVFSGDFNGDGRDDFGTWYDYADGHDTAFSFNPSSTDGKFGNRTEIWNVAEGQYWRDHMQISTGDYNGDGRDDLGAFYGYDNGTVRTITWTAKADGTLNEPVKSWTAETGWAYNRVTLFERYSS
ncbi:MULTISPECIES: FG-GAP-like repeat-containing protein [unclassified Streptomyces]|uniref:FG-GAP-like repeat-containing protein n=1 Tax=unclassified Streptomyces TaxID=2593676 RepID=UPI001F54302C|nr:MULTISPECIES: FG-GAP-like repeat-containing protein [unclassified Streptomyces]